MCRKQIEEYFLLGISVSFWFVCSPVHAWVLLCHLRGNLILLRRNSPKSPKASLCFNCTDKVRMFAGQKQCREPGAHRRCCNVFTPFTQGELSSRRWRAMEQSNPWQGLGTGWSFRSFPAQTILGFVCLKAWRVWSSVSWSNTRTDSPDKFLPLVLRFLSENFTAGTSASALWLRELCTHLWRIVQGSLQVLVGKKKSLSAPKWKARQCVMCPG